VGRTSCIEQDLKKQQMTIPPPEKQRLCVVKIGGNILDDETRLSYFLQQFASVEGNKILIHGGGKLATHLAKELNVEQQLIEGRRITDAATLRIVIMVYAGWINKKLVSSLHEAGINAFGVSGADGNLIEARKRSSEKIDYGFVGDVIHVNTRLIASLLTENLVLVIAPITHDRKGQLLNTNADTIAKEIAKSMADLYNVTLIYSFEKSGVLLDVANDASVIASLTAADYVKLKAEGRVHSGMIPKLDNAFSALDKGVNKVIIGQAEKLEELIAGKSGTTLQS
jgi:acetylglutamate kinase